jgi:membrane protease YdiL (CAAX protease family)
LSAISARAPYDQRRLTAGSIGALGAAVLLRVAFAAGAPQSSLPAATIFAAVLLMVAWICGLRPTLPRGRTLALGLLGGLVLLVGPQLHGIPPHRLAAPSNRLLAWSAVVALVACSEEVLLRGALYDAVRSQWGGLQAVAVSTAAFALLHVPLYGWQVLPLDLVVGLWLGVVRHYWGLGASMTAHTVADLAAGWVV